MLNWTSTKEEVEIISKIAKRFVGNTQGLLPVTVHEVMMDVQATHDNGTPLKLQDLLEAPNGDFNHDLVGIISHINRQTGKLEGTFLPRYAKENDGTVGL